MAKLVSEKPRVINIFAADQTNMGWGFMQPLWSADGLLTAEVRDFLPWR